MIKITEEWRDIEGYEELYQISNFGNVKSLHRIRKLRGNLTAPLKTRLLTPKIKNNGYVEFTLCKNGAMRCFLGHRLVANAFISNPENKPQVNHLDNDRKNNRVDNLCWGTQLENITYMIKCGRKKVRKGENHHSNKPILQFSKDGMFIKRWYSIREVRTNGYDHTNVWKALNGRLKSAYNSIWKYEAQ